MASKFESVSYSAITLNRLKAFITLFTGLLLSNISYAVNTYTVTSTANSGVGTLAQAILNANASVNSGGNDIISFAGFSGTIVLTSDLPAITEAVTIDGYTATGYAANTPKVGLNGVNYGFLINNSNAAGTIIRGIAITHTSIDAIQINGVNNITITGCWIGIDLTGAMPGGAPANKVNGSGIYITASSNNTIGGTASADRNVISGCVNEGVWLNNSSTGNQVMGNYIGTNTAGTAAIANSQRGVRISSSSNNNTIGGGTNKRNIISGNTIHGVFVETNSTGNLISSNYIGLGSDGSTVVANLVHGICINSASSTKVGGTTTADRNVISGNGTTGSTTNGQGISIESGSNNCLIYGNYIGLDATGTTAKANVLHGINVQSSTGTTIGTNIVGSGNVISGNKLSGFNIVSSSSGTIIKGNYIGINAAGTAAVANLQHGIYINGSNSCIIGGSTKTERNIISGNGNAVGCNGISILTSNYHKIKGNFIGTNYKGLAAIPNFDSGLSMSTSKGDSIGGQTLMERNVISGNTNYGIYMNDVDSCRFYGNYVGTDSTGNAALANNIHGIHTDGGSDVNYWYSNVVSGNAQEGFDLLSCNKNYLYGNFVGLGLNGTTKVSNGSNGVRLGQGASGASTNNVFGGTAAGQRNYVSGNGTAGSGSHGFSVDGGSLNNIFKNNYVGCDITGMVAVANSGAGIMLLDGSNSNTLGGTVAGEGNIFCCSTSDHGIRINISSNNVIYGNLIGVNAAKNIATGFGNNQYGIFLVSYSNLSQVSNSNIIGNTGSGANIIAGNGSDGVNVFNTGGISSNYNPIIGNKIYCNGGLGINHQSNSATENEGVNPPNITSSTANTVSGTGVNGYTVHVYFNSTGPSAACDCEGEIYLGSVVVAGGTWSLNHNKGYTATQQLNVTATQTNGTNSTSEFWVCTAPLPLSFLTFDLSALNGSVLLSWSTTREADVNQMEIERSSDGKTFEYIGKIDPKNNYNGINQYTYWDYNAYPQISYYRLKEVDMNGKVIYSEVKSVNFSSLENDIYFVPNPSKGKFKMVKGTSNTVSSLIILNPQGERVFSMGTINDATTSIDLSTLSPGVYFASITSELGSFIKKIVIE
jgi:hypothetical protein